MLTRTTSYRCQSYTTPLYCNRCGKQVKAPERGGKTNAQRFAVCNRCKVK